MLLQLTTAWPHQVDKDFMAPEKSSNLTMLIDQYFPPKIRSLL